MFGDYWIDYCQHGNPLAGVTRRWMETEQDFRKDLGELNTYPWEVLAFGFKTDPPSFSRYGPLLFSV